MKGGESVTDYLWLNTASSYTVPAIDEVGIMLWNRYGRQPLVYASSADYIKCARYYNPQGINNTSIVFATNTSGKNVFFTLSGTANRQSLANTYDSLYYGAITTVDDSVPGSFYSDAVLSLTLHESMNDALDAMNDGNWGGALYPITYSYTNSTVSGPSEAAIGDTVTVSAVPDNNYGITDPASQILVTNNDVAVEYQWNPSTNTITFVMPDPS